MSDNFKVCLTKIKDITTHSNSDNLEFAWVYGYSVIVRKNLYKVGDEVFYIPIDSVLDPAMADVIAPPDSKIKISKARIRQIKIRGAYSQGLIVNPSTITRFIKSPLKLEHDYAEELGITKYEPPTPSFQGPKAPKAPKPRDKPLSNPYFREFGGITNIKWHPEFFDGEDVVIQCKLHGSHIRFGRAPFIANTFCKKVAKFFRLAPAFEDVYGSNKVELTNRKGFKGFYGEDIYGKVLEKIKAFDKIKDGEFVHAEVIGEGIQRNYTYGIKGHHVVIFDVRVLQPDGTQKWLDPEQVEAYAKERGFDFVPVLYKGPFSKEIVLEHTSGPSVLCPSEPIREGCVVKARYNYDNDQSKRALKSINPDYLNDPTNTDNH